MITFLRSQRRLSSGEVLPPDPVIAHWRDQINKGAPFLLTFGDHFFATFGEPLQRLTLCPDNATQAGIRHTFAEVAFYLYEQGVGALACPVDGNTANDNCLELSLGDVVDYLQTGELRDRIPCTPPWGYPDGIPDEIDNHTDGLIGPLEEPSVTVLPLNLRRRIVTMFEQAGAVETGVSLFTAENGLHFLWFMYRTERILDVAQMESIASQVFWCLPRYYAAIVMPTNRMVKGYPLLSLRDE